MKFRFTFRSLLPGLFAALLVTGCGNDAAEAPAVARESSGNETPDTSPAARKAERQRILFFGDSITAGYGLDPTEAFPAVIQEKIDEMDWPFEAVNAGLSGETSAGGLRRIDWVLRSPVDVLVLGLGANDGLRGLSVGSMESNLKDIVERTREKNPDVTVIIAGMRMPPNLGQKYANDFGAAFPRVAKETEATLIPFLLQDVAGHPLLNQFDGVHPTARGQKIVADNVWEILKPILEERVEALMN